MVLVVWAVVMQLVMVLTVWTLCVTIVVVMLCFGGHDANCGVGSYNEGTPILIVVTVKTVVRL